ncbi:MAG: low temperature requirement protein A, partial [Perlucidibaca sp.]
WWMYFLLPSAEALHHHRERAFGWGYGHYALFAAVAAIGAGLEVVADVLTSQPALHAAGQGGAVGHGVSPLYAITMLALAEALFLSTLWALRCQAVRARDRQIVLTLAALCLVGLAPLAVAAGLPLSWGLLLLSPGPLLIIAYNEDGRRRCSEQFSVR